MTGKLTPTQLKALDYIGSHRKTNVIPGRKSCPVSKRTANALKRRGLVMYLGNKVILTYPGERIWSKLHPYSKYKIT